MSALAAFDAFQIRKVGVNACGAQGKGKRRQCLQGSDSKGRWDHLQY